MFDTTQAFELPVRTAQGKLVLSLRWPTDAEWIVRQKARKILLKRLGRGSTETSVESGDSDLQLYDKIKLNGAPPLTRGEAEQVITALAYCEVTDVEVDGTDAIVSLDLSTGPAKHRLRLPTADEVLALRRGAYSLRDLPFNKQELRTNPEHGGKLWDACHGASTDYADSPVPIIHKDTAVRAVIEFLDREAMPGRDEASFS